MKIFLSIVASVVLLSGAVLAAPVPGSLTEGIIASIDASSVTVTTRAGSQVRLSINSETVAIQRRSVKLEDIKRNEFVGVTARREPDGALTAISINVFPPEFRGRVREAQFVMDTGNIMTNATVFQNVRRIEGRTLYLRMGDGTAVIAVPRDTPVIRLTVIKVSDLKSGMPVMVRGSTGADGSLVASTITVDAR